jgi:hypothetical protein
LACSTTRSCHRQCREVKGSEGKADLTPVPSPVPGEG